MIKHFDHVTIVVRDVEAAKQFFGLLGFREDRSVVIAGPQFSAYMGVDGIEAEHVTLALANVSPRTEVQLLKYRHPDPLPDPAIGNLTKLGFNHVCFAVDDLEAEVARLKAKGVQLRNEVMDFQNRKLVFLSGPEGVTVELAEWDRSRGKCRISCSAEGYHARGSYPRPGVFPGHPARIRSAEVQEPRRWLRRRADRSHQVRGGVPPR
jgi:catechol 2,3-dioxygenase-like lactoylglutathione lyase family enzyme